MQRPHGLIEGSSCVCSLTAILLPFLSPGSSYAAQSLRAPASFVLSMLSTLFWGWEKKEDLEGQKKPRENNNRVSQKASDLCQTELNVFFGMPSSKPEVSHPWMTDHLGIAGIASTNWGARVKHWSSQAEQIYRLLLSTSLPRRQKGGGWATAVYGPAVWEIRQPSWNEGGRHQG